MQRAGHSSGNQPDDAGPSLAGRGRVLTAREVQSLLRCGIRHVHDLFDRGELEGFRDGRNKRFFEAGVLAYIARNSNAKAAGATQTLTPVGNLRGQAPARPSHARLGSVAMDFLSRVTDARSGAG